MTSVEQLRQWIATINTPHMVLGYGSLMSKDSRLRYSAIGQASIEVEVDGYERAWVTRSELEKQTYVGAYPKRAARLNAQLLPAAVNTDLKKRERDYSFTPVDVAALHFSGVTEVTQYLKAWLRDCDIRICTTINVQQATKSYPVSQSYIDTCLAGCLENGGEASAKRFIHTTKGWSHHRINDRHKPKYPRAAQVCDHVHLAIDKLLGTGS